MTLHLYVVVDIPVTFAESEQLEDDIRLAFTSATECIDACASVPIVVTETMKQVYALILERKSGAKISLSGPPGTGKTTTLYWLYQQFKNNPLYHTVAVAMTVESKMTLEVPPGKQLILLADLVSPSTLTRSQYDSFMQLKLSKKCILIIAESSMFSVFSTLNPSLSAQWDKLLVNSKRFMTKPFTSAETSKYLSNLTTIPPGLELCNNIPRLLSFMYGEQPSGERSIKHVIRFECNSLMEQMAEHGLRISWDQELKLLLAMSMKQPYTTYGLEPGDIDELCLIRSYLVYINDDNVPVSIYRLGESVFNHLIRGYWGNMCRYVQADSVAMIHNQFESCITKCILPKMGVTVAALRTEHAIQRDVQFEFRPICVRAMDLQNVAATEDVLWRMPVGYRAIDYAAYSNFNGKKYLIAVQVTIQQTDVPGKLRTSFAIPTELTSKADDGCAMLIFIDPFQENFDTNFAAAESVTSGPGGSRFDGWYYGQPSRYDDIHALIRYLNSIFVPMRPI